MAYDDNDDTVIGIKPPNETWKKMKLIYETCLELNIETPESVLEFFGWNAPSDDGVEVEIPYWHHADGVCINVTDIPAGVRMIKFKHNH